MSDLPAEVQDIVDLINAGDEDLPRLGIGQTGDRVFDDGVYRVWRERVGPDDGYFGPAATVEHFDGNRWTNLT